MEPPVVRGVPPLAAAVHPLLRLGRPALAPLLMKTAVWSSNQWQATAPPVLAAKAEALPARPRPAKVKPVRPVNHRP